MARKRIGMKKIREVIRLKSTTEMSDRQIARALNMSHPMVAKYWQGFNSSGLLFEQIEEMADSELLGMVGKPRIEKCNKYEQLIRIYSDPPTKKLKKMPIDLAHKTSSPPVSWR